MKTSKTKMGKVETSTQEYPDRLVELEAELRSYPTGPVSSVALTSVHKPIFVVHEKEKVVQFSFDKKIYSAGHTDRTYPGSNHAHGVRHVRFYAGGKVVLCVEGDFEDQQFGSNFKFHNTEVYQPGEWETDFNKLVDELRRMKALRREALKKKRDSAKPHHRFA